MIEIKSYLVSLIWTTGHWSVCRLRFLCFKWVRMSEKPHMTVLLGLVQNHIDHSEDFAAFRLDMRYPLLYLVILKIQTLHDQIVIIYILSKYQYVLIHIKVIQIIARQSLTECPLLHGNMEKETDTKIVFTETSGGCVIALRNNSFIDSKQHPLEPTQ